MDLFEAFQRLGVALAVGMLVGIERGWQERQVRAGGRTAGIRTFALIGLLGGLTGYLNRFAGPALPIALFLLFGFAFVLFKLREATEENDHSVTDVVVALVVFALGTASVLGEMEIAGAGGVVVAALLAARQSLHSFLRRLSWLELRATLVLLVMTIVALPILPDRTVDPWDALNPFNLWLLTVTIAAISYAGYIAIRLAGPSRGILFAGAAGGLVSSTALTLTFGRFAAETPDNQRRLGAGAIVAGTLSLLRVLVISVALAPSLALTLAAALLPAALAMLAAAFLAARREERGRTPDLGLENPFDLGMVLRFGALLGAVTWMSKVLVDIAGARMLFVVAGISGLVDLDAITLSTARLAGHAVDLRTASAAILLAVVVNLLTKVALAYSAAGRGRYAASLATATGVAVTAMVAGHVLLAPLLPATVAG
ncbi:DUF4010 domain-containing protein [Rhizobium sp. TRM95111]|uniref:MgtC/SapB family protein n=1 Tax=Rhizobium alarense TaxID=2846851 RepID=UPI001F1D798A|nr:DUF4010 domain-containing protein [Rhizobium alarense]MCF3639908.1 DUF4010 domain-containing protein [Rhizobium alarense]